MSSMWISWGMHNLQTEPNDWRDKKYVAKLLWHKYKIATVMDEKLFFWRDTRKMTGWNEIRFIPHQDRMSKIQIRTPDLWSGPNRLAIEIDGKVHKKKIALTLKRNSFYDKATEIKLIIIDKEDIAEETPKDVFSIDKYTGWEEYIDKELKKLGVINGTQYS